MAFQGRTCIYLFIENGKGEVRIKNGGSGQVKEFDIEDRIKHRVIYVEGSNSNGLQSKFDFDAGNVFISGTLKERLTVAAENIFITYADPTKWEEPSQEKIEGYGSRKSGGIVYYGTKFNGKKTDQGQRMKKCLLGIVKKVRIIILKKWFWL